ncbi:MAG: putative DNA binding domain-containing protein [Prevotellaceae bacterium]|nr:putative DNA binding domain-containing protein [Prevotellaceae bacterium]
MDNNKYILPDKESETVEFKSSFNADAIETLVAFSNTKGGAVYIGVADDAAISGISLGKETIPQWVNEIKSKTEPSIIPETDAIEIQGKQIVVLSIAEFPIKPVSVKGKYYKRVGNSNQLLNLNEILNLHIKTFNSSWDYYFDPNHSVLDISEEKTLQLIALYNRERKIPIEKDVFEFLSKMELIRDGKLTNAGFLLLMKNESVLSGIELRHFQNDVTIKDGITVSTDLVTEVNDILAFIRKHISKEFIITGNPAREERWDYPLDALREIVMNMVVHRDYSHHGDSSVKIYPDRIEFFNPGRLPDNISIDDLRHGTYVSNCRNKLISRIFKEIEWIERYGTGIKRIRGILKNYGSPEPVFENFHHGFRVIAYAVKEITENPEEVLVNSEKGPVNPEKGPVNPEKGPVNPEKGPVNPEKGPVSPEKITANQQKILDCIAENQYITREELVVIVGISLSKIKENISKLKAKGLLERIGSDKKGHWKIRN